MKNAENLDHGLNVSAWGRHHRSLETAVCEIESVQIVNGKLVIQCSAGGLQRGISIKTEMDLLFLLNSAGKILKSERAQSAHTQLKKIHDLTRHWLERDIGEMALDLKQINALRKYGKKKIEDICRMTKKDILSIPGIGPTAVSNIVFWLSQRHLSLTTR